MWCIYIQKSKLFTFHKVLNDGLHDRLEHGGEDSRHGESDQHGEYGRRGGAGVLVRDLKSVVGDDADDARDEELPEEQAELRQHLDDGDAHVVLHDQLVCLFRGQTEGEAVQACLNVRVVGKKAQELLHELKAGQRKNATDGILQRRRNLIMNHYCGEM